MQSILLATVLALVVGLTLTPWVIDVFRTRGIGKVIREDGPATHLVKHGTPTMGGIVLMIAATLGYAGAHLRWSDGTLRFQQFSRAGIVIFGTAWALGILGVIDDLLGIRPTKSVGMSARAKTAGQIVVALALALAALRWVGLESRVTWAGASMDWVPELPQLLFALYIFVIIWGTANGTNFADGADGLLAGSAAMNFFVFTIIAFWEFRNSDFYPQLAQTGVSGLLDVAVVSAAMLGACIGFLWWNAAPARIMMGDAGSMAIGGAIASLALFTRTQLLLPIIGGLFVMEMLSVIIQRGVFWSSRRITGTGRRVFAMAPFHHHFELRGWAEFTVIVRFWLIAALAAGLGLALFYMDFLSHGGAG